MPGRGRGLLSRSTQLRKPGPIEENGVSLVDDLLKKISTVTSPDDLEVTNLANKIKTLVDTEENLSALVSKLMDTGLDHRELTPVVAAIFGMVSQHQVGQMKLKSILLSKLQANYEKREELESTDRTRFVNSALFLGEIYHRCKSATGSPIKVLAQPVVTYLQIILKQHLAPDPGPDINEEMMVVAQQLLQNGHSLYELNPEALEEIVKGITEVMIRHSLTDSCRLNLLAALADLWPVIHSTLNSRTTHATLAAKLGLSLKI